MLIHREDDPILEVSDPGEQGQNTTGVTILLPRRHDEEVCPVTFRHDIIIGDVDTFGTDYEVSGSAEFELKGQ